MSIDFLTLPDELQGLANELLRELGRRGYRRAAEPNSFELPATPTVRALRGHETHYFLVRHTIAQEEMQKWVGYARSCPADTRISICFPEDLAPSGRQLVVMREQGIGIEVRTSTGFRNVTEPRDLAFHAQAPDRASLKPKVRALLGEALDRLDRGDWRPAFEDACAVLEEECRAYLVKKSKMGGVKYQSGSKVKIPTAREIRSMPLGAMKDVFCQMHKQNQVESNLCTALRKLNPDRILRAHYRRGRRQEAALRRRVGTHFWLKNNALAQLV